ncbi:hypothetical protein ATANTOWER_016679 [Ataeniobius toweri]|uniref:Haloacid dehalogenase-like hydrolase domain-containing 5 n=1 Tax=Ataeniobius toweri TaxID=208326 RepID=A0ABU7CH24_9TELE|nr:hypothetical protein [Ataeniobius toweri]
MGSRATLCVEVSPTISSRYLSTSRTSSGSFPPSEVTFHVPRASLSIQGSGRRGLHLHPPPKLCTSPSRFPLQVVGPLGDGLIRPLKPLYHVKGPSSFGLLFDIDGVLVRGRTLIPGAKECFRNLVDRNGKYKVPVVFVTNAGNCMRQTKAEHLSHLLQVEVSPDQVMLSHSPLRMFTQFQKKCVLVSGQGPVEEVAHNLGFENVVTIDMLREAYPVLDFVDHNRRPKDFL